MILYIGHTVHPSWIQNTLGVEQHSHIRDDVHTIPTIETEENALLHAFIDHLNDEKPYAATLYIIRFVCRYILYLKIVCTQQLSFN